MMAGKNGVDDSLILTVYSFANSVIIPTEQGSYWATAIGGEVTSRPTGSMLVLFELRYIWDLAGQVSELSEPVSILVNTAQAVFEKRNFKFPAIPSEPVPQEVQSPSLESEHVLQDESPIDSYPPESSVDESQGTSVAVQENDYDETLPGETEPIAVGEDAETLPF